MPPGPAMLPLGQGSLGDQRSEAGVVGLLGELSELFLGDLQVVTKSAEATTDIAQTPLDLPPGHGSSLRHARPGAGLMSDVGNAWDVAVESQIRAVSVAVILLASCGGGDDSGCAEVREQLDAASGLHIIDVASASYQTDPPTSGPHVAAAPPVGVAESPIPAPLQVTILEAGGALIQWDPSIDDADRAELERLAGPAVVVAPGTDLPSPIVATAWTWKLTCRHLDVDAITEFATTRSVGAPGPDR